MEILQKRKNLLTITVNLEKKRNSSFDGHLGCVHVLAIANNAAARVGVDVSVLIMVFSGYIARIRIDN